MSTATAPAPARVQRQRTAGWKKPDGAVYVGRGSKWGNPYRLGTTQVRTPALDGSMWEQEGRLGKRSGQWHGFVHPDGTVTSHLVQDAAPEQVVELYRRWVAGRPGLVDAVREQLAGRDLMCWCPLEQPCHADWLLDVANGDMPTASYLEPARRTLLICGFSFNALPSLHRSVVK
ncbi:DUF4326 domain-containing protein [Streptomyces sp. MS1.AVA.3]|uniref:DUF4326 domain-containing protein n=1 Tax=Streptomyces decoyicus TaxID=249567 RepID=UPI0030BED4DA